MYSKQEIKTFAPYIGSRIDPKKLPSMRRLPMPHFPPYSHDIPRLDPSSGNAFYTVSCNDPALAAAFNISEAVLRRLDKNRESLLLYISLLDGIIVDIKADKRRTITREPNGDEAEYSVRATSADIKLARLILDYIVREGKTDEQK